MSASAKLWSALDSIATAITGVVTTGLRNWANNAQQVGSEIDNTGSGTARRQFADFILDIKFGTNPSAGGYIALYLIQAADGTNYADGADTSTTPPASAWVGNFGLRAVTTAQKITLRGVLLPPTKFKMVAINKSGQTTSNTNDTDSILKYVSYSEENQ